MNLQPTAQKLAAQGRNGDTMLVHMSPGEVGGLQALAMAHGGSLSINPKTGLPEAFFLAALVPTLLGALAPTLGAAATGAGLTTLGTFLGSKMGAIGLGALAGGLMNKENPLMGAISGGFGGYGGAGIGNALTNAGSQAAVASALPQGGATAIPTAASQSAGQSLLAQSLSAPHMTSIPGAAGSAGSSLLQATGAAPMSASAVAALQNQAAQNFAQQSAMSQLSQGVQSLAKPGGLSNFGSALMENFPSTTAKIAAATPFVSALSTPTEFKLPKAEDPYANYEGPYLPTVRNVMFPEEGRRASSEFTYFDPSNPVPYADGGAVEDRAVRMAPRGYNPNQGEFNYNFRPIEIAGSAASQIPARIGGKGGAGFERFFDMLSRARSGGKDGYDKYTDLSNLKYDPRQQRMVRMAEGGSVPQLEDGGFVLTKKAVDGLGNGSNTKGQRTASAGLGALPIKGKGHGTSDSIKTTIDGKVPARVSNGEAYIPRRNVQKAGGAQKLYALMKRAERRA